MITDAINGVLGGGPLAPAATVPTPTPTPTATVTAAPTTAATTAASPTGSGTIVADYTDQDGYTYHFLISNLHPQVDVDVADAKPGSAIVHFSYNASGTVSNTTPGHNAPVKTLELLPVWPLDSTICQQSDTVVFDVAWTPAPLNAGTGNVAPGPTACYLTVVTLWHPVSDGNDLQVGETRDLDSAALQIGSNHGGSVTVPEGGATAMQQALENPAGWALIDAAGNVTNVPDSVCKVGLYGTTPPSFNAVLLTSTTPLGC